MRALDEVVQMDEGGAEGKEEYDRARGKKWRGKAGGVESWSDRWLTTNQGGAGGKRESCGASGMRELGAKAEPMGRSTEVESRARRLDTETGIPHA